MDLELAAARALSVNQPEDTEHCWADNDASARAGLSAACGAPTDDPLGLCPKHRAVLFGG
jgi:hypothetical protein